MNLLDMIQPQEKVTVVISRHWDNPKITVSVNHEKIVLMESIEDFVNQMSEEIVNPALILTRKQLKEKMKNAMLSTLEKVKEASGQVM